MSGPAGVHSIEALADFKAALAGFKAQANDALSEMELEIRRANDWLRHDQLNYWQSEVRHRQDEVAQAKADLDRSRISATFGRTPDCTDQKVALKKARLRLEDAERKVDAVRHWSRVVEKETAEYLGPAQQLANLLAGHLPQAIEELERMMVALESYVALAGPSPGPALRFTSARTGPASRVERRGSLPAADELAGGAQTPPPPLEADAAQATDRPHETG